MTASITASAPTAPWAPAQAQESATEVRPDLHVLKNEFNARRRPSAQSLEKSTSGATDATASLLEWLRPTSTNAGAGQDTTIAHAQVVLKRQCERCCDSARALTDAIRPGAGVDGHQRSALDGDSSEQDFFDAIGDLIGSAKEGYLDLYAEALRKYTEFFEELTKILLELKVAASGDKNVSGNFLDIKNKLAGLLNTYGDIRVGPRSSQADAERLAGELGPGFIAKYDPSSREWIVVVDTSTVQAFAASLPDKNGEVSNTEYNNIVSNKDSMTSSVNRGAQLSGENFSRANATYQNLIKLLSSLIESMFKMMEARLPS